MNNSFRNIYLFSVAASIASIGLFFHGFFIEVNLVRMVLASFMTALFYPVAVIGTAIMIGKKMLKDLDPLELLGGNPGGTPFNPMAETGEMGDTDE